MHAVRVACLRAVKCRQGTYGGRQGQADMYAFIGQVKIETLARRKQLHVMHQVKPETHKED